MNVANPTIEKPNNMLSSSSEEKISTNTKLIDVDFAVTAISALSHAERSAFKPVYSMNKWWARRSSSVFRAILLGLALSPKDNLMDSFYLNHQETPKVKGKIILDPFMGGGTSIVEGLRLSYKAIGVDLNPLSWFIVKTETERVDKDDLESAFKNLESEVAETIKNLFYKLSLLFEQS